MTAVAPLPVHAEDFRTLDANRRAANDLDRCRLAGDVIDPQESRDWKWDIAT